jgi:hypothetical protein
LEFVKTQAASAIASAEGMVESAIAAGPGLLAAVGELGNQIKKVAEDRLAAAVAAAASTTFNAVKEAALTAFNAAKAVAEEAAAEAKAVAESALGELRKAASALEAMTGDVVKWIEALADDPSKIFRVDEARFHSDWAEMVSQQKIGFTFKARALDLFDIDIVVDFDMGALLRRIQGLVDDVRTTHTNKRNEKQTRTRKQKQMKKQRTHTTAACSGRATILLRTDSSAASPLLVRVPPVSLSRSSIICRGSMFARCSATYKRTPTGTKPTDRPHTPLLLLLLLPLRLLLRLLPSLSLSSWLCLRSAGWLAFARF